MAVRIKNIQFQLLKEREKGDLVTQFLSFSYRWLDVVGDRLIAALWYSSDFCLLTSNNSSEIK